LSESTFSWESYRKLPESYTKCAEMDRNWWFSIIFRAKFHQKVVDISYKLVLRSTFSQESISDGFSTWSRCKLNFCELFRSWSTIYRCSLVSVYVWFRDFRMHVEPNASMKVAQTLQKWSTREYFKCREFRKKPPRHWGSQNFLLFAHALSDRLFAPWERKSRIFENKISKKFTRFLLRRNFPLKLGENVYYDPRNTLLQGNWTLFSSWNLHRSTLTWTYNTCWPHISPTKWAICRKCHQKV